MTETLDPCKECPQDCMDEDKPICIEWIKANRREPDTTRGRGRMITIDEVQTWLMLSGIGHVLCGTRERWHSTACGTWTPNGESVSERPKRKCRACIAALPKLKHSSHTSTEREEE